MAVAALLPLKGRVFKIGILKISGSALAAEICIGPHNRLLRRQHCSSLCSQSEGHEHVANMASALGHNFVGFSARAWSPQYSPPSLCEQSELQCFAPGLRQMSARCPLQRCHTRYAIYSQNRTDIFLDFEHPTQRGLNPLPSSMPPPSLPTSKYTQPFLLFPQARAAEKSIRQSIPYASQRTTPQMRTYHVLDADVSRPRRDCITSQTR